MIDRITGEGALAKKAQVSLGACVLWTVRDGGGVPLVNVVKRLQLPATHIATDTLWCPPLNTGSHLLCSTMPSWACLPRPACWRSRQRRWGAAVQECWAACAARSAALSARSFPACRASGADCWWPLLTVPLSSAGLRPL